MIEQAEYSGAEIINFPLILRDPDPLLACPEGSRTAAWASEHGVRTVDLPARTMRHSGGLALLLASVPRGFAGARDLRRVLRAHPERRTVYAIAFRSGLLAALAGLGLRRRVVWYVSDFPPPGPLGHAVRAVARLSGVRALAVSRSAARHFVGRSRRLARRTRVVYPGVDPARFRTPAGTRDATRAAVLGHVSHVKRTDVAIEVARAVAREHPGFALDVIGRAQFRDEDFALEHRLHAEVAADPALRRTVTFRGYAEDPATTLGRYGLLLHCRTDEPFGIAIVEAMAAGLAVVVPDTDGPAEIVRHEETGLVYRAGDVEHAAAHLLRLLRDPALRDRLGRAAAREVAHRFSIGAQLQNSRNALAAVGASSAGMRRWRR